MESSYRALSSHRVWDLYGSTNAVTVEVTELCFNTNTGKLKAQHTRVLVSCLSTWLKGSPTKVTDDGPLRTVLRLVWVEQDREKMELNLSSEAFANVLKSFYLQPAYRYHAGLYTGITEVPIGQSPMASRLAHDRSFAFSYHPKLAVLWSHMTPAPPASPHSVTNIVFLSTLPQIAAMRSLFENSWDVDVASHVMFPLLLCGILLSQEIYSTQSSIKTDVRQVEVRTGYHRFANRHEPPATEELGELSARMSGCEAKLASITRKLKTLEEVCGFTRRITRAPLVAYADGQMLPQQASMGNPPDTVDTTSDKTILHTVDLLDERIRMQSIDNEYIAQRARIQVNALFNLITQYDSLISLKIAQASHLSAMSSQHDSSSMKTLAVVTMVFLPGSFVATLFSAEFSDLEAPKFSLYWAVAIPLTTCVFILYVLWLVYYRVKQNKLSQNAAQWEATQPLDLEEVRMISLRRGTLHEK